MNEGVSDGERVSKGVREREEEWRKGERERGREGELWKKRVSKYVSEQVSVYAHQPL